MPTSVQADNQSLNRFFETCQQFADRIDANEAALYKLLSAYETHETVKDELERSTETLRGMQAELAPLAQPLSGLTMVTFFPLNLPLYSLVLFAIAPSVFCHSFYVRPPEVMQPILEKLWKLLDIKQYFPHISLKNVPRHIFIDLYANESDAIIFTGKYENALAIHASCPNSLLLYNGSGINPFILFDNADVNLAARKAVEMRCFNSGQDCAGPDAFFVPAQHADAFVENLKAELSHVKVGDTENPETNIGPTMKQSYITELKEWLKQSSAQVIYGGQIDEENHFVYPTIVRSTAAAHNHADFHEFFAPFFYVLTYNSDDELADILLSAKFKERGMYISIFGSNPDLENQLTFVRLIRDKIVNDVERGNTAYGGYGDKANFVLSNEEKTVQPILVSRELHAFLPRNTA